MILHHEQRQSTVQKIDPKIILANTILQLSAVELSQSIEAELMENPALDVLDESSCSGDCIDPGSCPYCSQRMTRSDSPRQDSDSQDSGEMESDSDSSYQTRNSAQDEDVDPVGNIGAELSLREHLLGLMRASLPREDFQIGTYIISNLNERGWLGDSIESIALDLNVDPAAVERVLLEIQQFDPPGIGARTIQECLMLQIRHLREEDAIGELRRIHDLADRMIRLHFEHLPLHHYEKLARLLKASVDEVKEVIEYIGTHLNPFPASQFIPPWNGGSNSAKSSVRPDVIIRRQEFGYEVEITGSDAVGLAVNPLYRDLYNSIKAGSEQHAEQYRRHVLEYVDRAELFIRNINMRRQTLRQITKCIVDCQTGYLETGSRQFMRSLTRTRVAQILGIHESTVSRATANKFVQLPNQEVVNFDIFFNTSLSIKDTMAAIIHGEDPSNPLSDIQIAEKLAERGIVVARRTVVKYRNTMKILSSARRRR